MVRTGNVDFSCKTFTSIEIRKSKYHIIRRVRFRWRPPPPPRKISGSALASDCQNSGRCCKESREMTTIDRYLRRICTLHLA